MKSRRQMVLALALSAMACDEPAEPTDGVGAALTQSSRMDDSASMGVSPNGEGNEPPVAAVASARPRPRTRRRLEVTASDGLVLVGELGQRAGSEGPVVVLLHQLGSERGEWEPLIAALDGEPPSTTLAMDMRGHGESVEGVNDRRIDWRAFGPADWRRLASDVRLTLDALFEAGIDDSRRLVLVGSSIGSSAAIIAASEDERIDAVVAVSPGRSYRDLDALAPLGRLGDRPILAVAARGEAAAAETADAMARVASRGTAVLFPGTRHGVGLFEEAPESLAAVVSFIDGGAEAHGSAVEAAP